MCRRFSGLCVGFPFARCNKHFSRRAARRERLATGRAVPGYPRLGQDPPRPPAGRAPRPGRPSWYSPARAADPTGESVKRLRMSM